jgi:hypothetical protein
MAAAPSAVPAAQASFSAASDDSAPTFSPVENEPPLRWQRAVHLAPRSGLGVARRALFYTALAWLPLAIWAAFSHRLFEGPAGESLLQHFGVNARCLIGIPLLILAEASLHKTLSAMIPQFTRSGIVAPAARAGLERILRDSRRLRDTSLPWVLMLGVALAWTVIDTPDPNADEMAWAVHSDGRLGFGGLWLAYVARPIFFALLLGWLWRLGLMVVLFVRIGRLDLSLVPTHPDRVGGLGFIEPLPKAVSLVTFALAAVLASRWAHEVLYHGQSLAALKLPAAVFVVGWALLLLLPLVALAPALMGVKRRALPEYSALVEEHGRLVNRRWIQGQPVPDHELLDAPEIGSVADTAAIYQSVAAMRPFPISKRSLMAILVPIAVPMLIVVALQIPIKEVLLKLLKTLI